MQPTMFAVFVSFSTQALAMSGVGLAILVIGLFAARNDVARAQGIDKLLALTNLCFAVPLGIFGGEHFGQGRAMLGIVPSYMPWRLFWVYFVGCALVAAAIAIATRIQVYWAGVQFGIMMFLFVAMVHLPGAIKTGGRLLWTIVCRESSFGAGGLVLAGTAISLCYKGRGSVLVHAGRTVIGIAAIVFGVQHFFHPLGMPGVPLVKQMPDWVPARALIGYLTGASLVVAGVSFLLARKARLAATYAGAWIVLLVIVIYVPVMIGALADPKAAVQIEGINYFADTLLFCAVILTVASAGRAGASESR